MPESIPLHAVVVSRESFESDDPYDLVDANIGFINALFEEFLRADEVPEDGLRSYYVDYYLAQVENGGFSQFVYNSAWNEQLLRYLQDGLKAIGAHQHLALFDEGARLVAELGPERLANFLASDYFGENPERDELNAPDDAIFALAAKEDLTALNAAWLRGLPHLVVLSEEELRAEVRRRGEALPNRAERIAAARENEPRYMKLIRALCEQAGHALTAVTAGDPTHEHQGVRTVAWHFLTDQGHFYLVDTGAQALMFHGDTHELITRLDAPEEWG